MKYTDIISKLQIVKTKDSTFSKDGKPDFRPDDHRDVVEVGSDKKGAVRTTRSQNNSYT